MALSQIIVTSRYLKSGSTKNVTKRKNYTKYIATRETVELRGQEKYEPNAPTKEKQKSLLKELLADFPEAKRYLEYEDYIATPTAQNATELINCIIERNADVIGNRRNFVGYMALRPSAEQRGGHGLFTDSDEPIVLNHVADEVAHHPGNVWSHVVSLRRGDAVRLGYDNSESWRQLVKRHISDIAEQSRIPLCDMKWYAAYHDTAHHPHIHLIVYSKNPKQGFLTKDGIDSIRSAFANDIFHDELQNIYQEQTVSRDELKSLSRHEMNRMMEQLQSNEIHNPELEKLVFKMHQELQTVGGKKVYGYLPQNVKRMINDVFAALAKQPQIQSMYEKWCELELLKCKVYTQKERALPPLINNPQFKSVKNLIIRAVLEMKPLDMVDERSEAVEYEAPVDYGDEYTSEDFEWHDENDVVINVSNDTDAESETVPAYSPDEYCREDFVLNDENAVTIEIPTASSDYEIEIVDEPEEAEQVALDNTILGLLISLSRIIRDDYDRGHHKLQKQVDSKLLRVIQRQKEELGVHSHSSEQQMS